MQIQTRKRYLAYLLLAAVFACPATSVSSQQRKTLPNNDGPIVNAACPMPISLTLPANPPSLAAGDLTAAQLGAQVGFNYPGTDKHVAYTFYWKREERCCQITKALLTVKVIANQGGRSSTSSDAGNDGIAIMHSGVSVQSQALYTQFPVIAGQTYVVQVNLNPAALNNINAFGHLTFDVEDDSRVISATLQLSGCCLATSTPATTSYPTQSECEQHEKASCSFQAGGWHRTD